HRIVLGPDQLGETVGHAAHAGRAPYPLPRLSRIRSAPLKILRRVTDRLVQHRAGFIDVIIRGDDPALAADRLLDAVQAEPFAYVILAGQVVVAGMRVHDKSIGSAPVKPDAEGTVTAGVTGAGALDLLPRKVAS